MSVTIPRGSFYCDTMANSSLVYYTNTSSIPGTQVSIVCDISKPVSGSIEIVPMPSSIAAPPSGAKIEASYNIDLSSSIDSVFIGGKIILTLTTDQREQFSGKILKVAYYNASNKTWEYVPTVVNGSTVIATVTHFSPYALMSMDEVTAIGTIGGKAALAPQVRVIGQNVVMSNMVAGRLSVRMLDVSGRTLAVLFNGSTRSGQMTLALPKTCTQASGIHLFAITNEKGTEIHRATIVR